MLSSKSIHDYCDVHDTLIALGVVGPDRRGDGGGDVEHDNRRA
jgi:hypothetical protein